MQAQETERKRLHEWLHQRYPAQVSYRVQISNGQKLTEACLKARSLADPVSVFKRVPLEAAVLRINSLSADVYAPLDVPPQHPLLVLPQRLQFKSKFQMQEQIDI